MFEQENVDWERVWRSFLEHGHDLQRIATAALRGESIDASDAEDLVHTFVIDRLPRLAPSLDAIASPTERARFVRVAFRNFVRDAARRAGRHDAALEAFAAEPAATPDQPPLGGASVDAALRGLPRAYRDAVRRYLGVDGAPSSIREIARELGTTRHAARTAVVDGLLLVAHRLGASGRIDPDDLEVTARVLAGQSISRIAAERRVPPQRIRQAIGRARGAIATSLS